MSVIDQILNSMYYDVDRIMTPMLSSRVRYWLSSEIDVDDAKQEARMSMLSAMKKYDFNNGDIVPYMFSVVVNSIRSMVSKSNQVKRKPHIYVLEEDGWKKKAVAVTSMDTEIVKKFLEISVTNQMSVSLKGAMTDQGELAYQTLIHRESSECVDNLRCAILGILGDRDKEVFNCKFDPPLELVKKIEDDGGDPNNPRNVDIADFLGINKNQLDWALLNIKHAFTSLEENDQFSELFSYLVNKPGWPMVHVKQDFFFDQSYVDTVFKSRGLCGKVESDTEEVCDVGSRRIIRYKWGCVVAITIYQPYACYTIVIEGDFNHRSGDVTGLFGARKSINVKGYASLARSIAGSNKGCIVENESNYDVLPHCVGNHETDSDECNGSTSSPPPCCHRDVCIAWSLYVDRIEEKGGEIDNYLKVKVDANNEKYCSPVNVTKFTKLMEAVIKAYGIADGSQNNEPDVIKKEDYLSEDKTSPRVKPRSETSVGLDLWYERWLNTIISNTGRRVSELSEASVGDLLVSDRRTKSGYVGLYCKSASGRPLAVGYIHYKPRKNAIDMKVPLAPGDWKGIDQQTMKTLRPIDHRDGAFISLCKSLGEKAIIIGAQAISELINNGIIELPDPQ